MLNLVRRLQYLLRQRRLEAELAEEIENHRVMEQRRLENAGMSSVQAAHVSRRTLGNVTLAREDARGVWIWPWLESVRQDLRYSGRTLVREPGFALLAVVTLGCALGLNTSLLTVFNAVALRPWPVDDPSRLLTVVPGVSLSEYEYFRAHARSFSGLATSRCVDGVSDGCELELDGESILANLVSDNYFRVLGVGMARGSGFTGDAGRPGVPAPVAVISDATWQARFARDPGVVGRVIRLDDVPFTIVGIAEAPFNGTSVERTGIWIPLGAPSLVRPHFVLDSARLGTRSVDVRLADGASVDGARAELELLHRQFGAGRSTRGSGIVLRRTMMLPASGVRRMYATFALMAVGVGLVLVLACANVGNLLLSRAIARRAEVSVRLSIGASRTRVIRQLLTESVVIAALATILGLIIAWTLPDVLVAWLVGPVGFRATPDATVLASAVALAVATCLAFGLAPAFHGSRASLTTALRGRTSVPGMRMPLGGVLLAIQVAVSVILLVSASLTIRGARALATQDLGFDIDGVDVISFELPASFETPRVRAFAREVIANAQQIAGAGPVGLANIAPFEKTDRFWTTVSLLGEDAKHTVLTFEVSAGYFDVLRLPFVAGRNFVDGDVGAIVINERMARWYWPGGNAVGQTIRMDGERRIIGVVKDARRYYGGRSLLGPTTYVPAGPRVIPRVLLRQADRGVPAAMVAFATRIEPRAEVRIEPVSQTRARLVERARVGPMLAGALGVLAVALASIGVFSVFACAVAQRTTEIGIRLALGAPPAQIVSLVVGTNGRALLVGIGAGVMGAAAGSQLLRHYLYGISPLDPVSFVSTAAVLAFAGVAATFVPARRATLVDPIRALRHE